MGAYLYYKLSNKKQAEEYNKFITETEEGQRLIKANCLIGVNDNEDVKWAEEKYPQMVSFYKNHIGEGDFKASGIFLEDVKNADCQTLEELFEVVTVLFVKAQSKFKMWFASRSCAFNLEGTYFSIEQMKRITQNGSRLKTSHSDPEKYEKLMELLKG